jgi:hypothetical protein
LRSALTSSFFFMCDRPSMPTWEAFLRSSSTVQSSYEPALPPLRPTFERDVLCAALAMRAAFSLLAPSSRSSS